MMQHMHFMTLVIVVTVGIGACSSPNNTFGSRLQAEGEQFASLGKKWEQGSEEEQEGERLVKDGQRAVADGESKIERGRRMIDNGRRSQRDVEETYKLRMAPRSN